MIESEHIKESRPPWDQMYYESMSQTIADVVAQLCCDNGKEPGQYRVLDVGCGTGEVMYALNRLGFKPFGVDINLDCAKKSSEHGSVVVSELMKLNRIFPEDEFDVVICSHVLEHMDNPGAAVAVLRHISAKYLIIAVPNLARLANFGVRQPRLVNRGHRMGWDCHHLRTFLEIRCDLKIVGWLKDGVTLPPLRNKYLYQTKLLKFIEYGLLPKIVPQQVSSLIVLCET